MKVKFFCNNHCLDFEKTEVELQKEKVITHCPFCGEKLRILNLEEILTTGIEEEVKRNTDKWLNTLGIEGTIELIERNKEYSVSRLYEQELRRRGVIK